MGSCAAWVRATWPDQPDFVAIDGKTSRPSHDHVAGTEPIHLVSAFATTAGLVLSQEAVPDKSNELTAIPTLLAGLAGQDGLRGALVSIDAIATNGTIAKAIRDTGADYVLAVKANQPPYAPRSKPASPPLHRAPSRPIPRTRRAMAASNNAASAWYERPIGWRRAAFPGRTTPLPDVACIVRAQASIERGGKAHSETRYYISSAVLDAERAGQAVRGHWGIENRLHWVLDVNFNNDQSCLRKVSKRRTWPWCGISR